MTEAVRGGLLLSMVIGGTVMDCEKEEGREKEKEKSIGTQITVCFLFVNQKLVWFCLFALQSLLLVSAVNAAAVN